LIEDNDVKPEILKNKEDTLKLIVDKLGSVPSSFSKQFNIIRQKRKQNLTWLAAGVLLLLSHKKHPCTIPGNEEEFVFQLIKRSASVPQGGDLSCPGGILETPIDGLFCGLIGRGFPPIIKGDALTYAKERGEDELNTITLFLANATRESWEEIGLNPFDLIFLGPLPCYNLTLFTKTIFPLVGLMNGETGACPNGEVDKIIEIPLVSFFDENNYAIYSLDASGDFYDIPGYQWDFPCLTHQDTDGTEEILWGATFSIIMSFLKIVFDFKRSDLHPTRIIRRALDQSYITGNSQ
jgi:8-oxo-dGTP pyrophosphatase MutT (NUDIX family)